MIIKFKKRYFMCHTQNVIVISLRIKMYFVEISFHQKNSRKIRLKILINYTYSLYLIRNLFFISEDKTQIAISI